MIPTPEKANQLRRANDAKSVAVALERLRFSVPIHMKVGATSKLLSTTADEDAAKQIIPELEEAGWEAWIKDDYFYKELKWKPRVDMIPGIPFKKNWWRFW